MVAQHRANKNIPLALQAFENLLRRKKMGKPGSFLLVGNHGPETDAIRSCFCSGIAIAADTSPAFSELNVMLAAISAGNT